MKILPPDSTFFKILPGKGRKPDQTDNKVAPGMEVSYIATWQQFLLSERCVWGWEMGDPFFFLRNGWMLKLKVIIFHLEDRDPTFVMTKCDKLILLQSNTYSHDWMMPSWCHLRQPGCLVVSRCIPVVALQLWTVELKNHQVRFTPDQQAQMDWQWLGAIKTCGFETGQTYQNGLMDCDFVQANLKSDCLSEFHGI